jgi:hypothetical protein
VTERCHDKVDRHEALMACAASRLSSDKLIGWSPTKAATSALPPKADMFSVELDVCFVPNADVRSPTYHYAPFLELAESQLTSLKSGSLNVLLLKASVGP